MAEARTETHGTEVGAGGAGSRTLGLERWVQFGFIAMAGLAFWLLGHLFEAIWNVFADPQMTAVPLIAGGISVAAAIFAYRHPAVHRFANEVASELSMVTWPPRKETWTNTVVVIVTSIIAAAILGVFDAAWSTATDLIYSF